MYRYAGQIDFHFMARSQVVQLLLETVNSKLAKAGPRDKEEKVRTICAHLN